MTETRRRWERHRWNEAGSCTRCGIERRLLKAGGRSGPDLWEFRVQGGEWVPSLAIPVCELVLVAAAVLVFLPPDTDDGNH